MAHTLNRKLNTVIKTLSKVEELNEANGHMRSQMSSEITKCRMDMERVERECTERVRFFKNKLRFQVRNSVPYNPCLYLLIGS